MPSPHVIGLVAAFLALTPVSALADDWQFQVTPYSWLAGFSGTAGILPGVPPADFDVPLSDALDDLAGAAMVLGTARNGSWVVLFDATYARLNSTEPLGGILFSEVSEQGATSTLSLAVGRQIHSRNALSVDAYVGLRGWHRDSQFRFRRVIGGDRKVDVDRSWVDPLIGINAVWTPHDNWTLFTALDAGGGFGGADYEYSVLLGASYAVNDWFAASFGWRQMGVKYDRDDFLFDLTQSGPIIGATFRF